MLREQYANCLFPGEKDTRLVKTVWGFAWWMFNVVALRRACDTVMAFVGTRGVLPRGEVYPTMGRAK